MDSCPQCLLWHQDAPNPRNEAREDGVCDLCLEVRYWDAVADDEYACMDACGEIEV